MTLKLWPPISEDALLETPIFKVIRRQTLSPKDGLAKTVYGIESSSWVSVLAVTKDAEALLVRQFRHGSQELSLELPGGIIEAGQTPLEAAQRELREETGYAAASWAQLTALRPNPAIFSNTAYGFLAEGAVLDGPVMFDENEDLELVKVPIAALETLLATGRIDHAIMVAIISIFLLRRS